ncbi:MAG: DUF523 domain-containing protein [Actinobacteria bacterium]|nr:DUF523 domain-containing protein [Actinomycetota bacterium]
MQLILVSACLLGHPVRYDGGGVAIESPVLRRWAAEGRVVAVCPEVDGGLPTPRPPAEISYAAGESLMLEGQTTVTDATGLDVTESFVRGAEHTLDVARARDVRITVLKDGSPSCGTASIYDGSFSGRRVPAPGITAARLLDAGIRVFSEAQIDEAALCLAQLESEGTV